ncbi:digeranylgeranylglycerophospholipid reductase [Vulcanisaeta distributa]|uniref:Geranylgeranyl reductase n=1 Tax=Vulcanisaeta distributa (strain DSM 14429 / JCM 11212 / NBRC 100878 / IC-017) TaxID=572478 RepID=E1QP50_VULDI|nr:digeranylgeranylglycerophospholipid reductase [Vulcanisaeta distributa]ADN50221.1 geranylgeranyl reductase [Vulcanisaeta distributa DSM 14429]
MVNFDVIVVGAGTAGSYASYLLAKAGLNVALIEMKRRDKVFKTTGDAIGIHHIERMAIKPPSDVFMIKYEGAELFSPDLSIKYVVLGRGFGLDMARWAQWLIGEAERAGAHVFDNHKVQGPIIENGFVSGVRVLKPDGSTEEFRAKVVIDASGVGAVVRSRLPREWWVSEPLLPEDVSNAYREIIQVDYDIEKPEYIKIYLDTNIAPGGYWWLFPKSRNTMNIGLGLWGKLSEEQGLNPRHNYDRYLANSQYTRGRRIIHVGGGIVPTRRPLPSLVANGFLAAGDAAVTVNPVHGGGIGPALLSAELASKTVIEAFEKGDFSERGLWRYNIEYLRAYGIKQAMLDVFRLMLQTLTNDQLNRGLRARLLTEDEVLEISEKGSLELSFIDKLKVGLRLMKVPDVASKLRLALRYMNEVKSLYETYPEDPSGLSSWYRRLVSMYREYTDKLGISLKWLSNA